MAADIQPQTEKPGASTTSYSSGSSPRDSVEKIETNSKDIVKVKSQILEEYKPASEPKPALNSLWKRKVKRNPDEIATQPSVFDDPSTAHFFQPHEKYENLHRFDPEFRWTVGEEAKLVRTIDWKVTAWAIMGLFALNLNRSNLSQANTDNFLKDMKLTTNGMLPKQLNLKISAEKRED